MNKSVVPVEIRTVLPFNAGRAVFIGNDEKVFVIYVDEGVGSAISMFMNSTPKERPLETYFARLIVSAENELFEKKIIELDGRPSDCIALAIQQKAPIYVSKEVWEEVEDRSDVLRQIEDGDAGGEAGGAAGAPDSSTTGPSAARARPLRPSDGAISARTTSVPPHSGQATRPRPDCASNPALSLNQPSNPCPAPQRSW